MSDDGSTDGTPEIVEALDLANVVVIANAENQGKGAAVRAGLRAARGRRVLFSDADLSTPIEALPRFFAAMDDGADVVIASRGVGGAVERHKSRVRSIVSWLFRLLTRTLFPLGIEDTQCGFKLFTDDAASALSELQTIDGFSFDLELLWLARRLGRDVVELPVRWTDAPGSKVDPRREAARFLGDMARIRFRHRQVEPTATGSGLRVGVVTPLPPSSRTLNEYGHHLVGALAAKPDVAEVVVLADVDSTGAPVPAGVRLVTCWRFGSLSNLIRIVWRARRERPDVLLYNIQFASFGSGRVSAALGLLAPVGSRLLGVPSVVLLHNLVDTVDLGAAGFASNGVIARLMTGIGRLLTRALLRANRVAVTMPGYVDLLRDRYKARNVYLAPHGSFGDGSLPPLSVPNRHRLLTFGKFGTYKRVDELVAAYRCLVADGFDAELVIAGTDSPNRPGYLAGVAAANRDLPGLVFTGYVPEEDVAPLFRSSTAVVFPYSATTGSSGPLHQTGQHGRAAVLPTIGDFLDVLAEEGYTGASFTPGDVDSLADAIRLLLSDSGERERIAAQNARAARGCTMADVVDLHLLHLRAVA